MPDCMCDAEKSIYSKLLKSGGEYDYYPFSWWSFKNISSKMLFYYKINIHYNILILPLKYNGNYGNHTFIY